MLYAIYLYKNRLLSGYSKKSNIQSHWHTYKCTNIQIHTHIHTRSQFCIAVYQTICIVPLLFLRPRTIDGICQYLIVRLSRTIEDYCSHESYLCTVRKCPQTYGYTNTYTYILSLLSILHILSQSLVSFKLRLHKRVHVSYYFIANLFLLVWWNVYLPLNAVHFCACTLFTFVTFCKCSTVL